MRTNKQQAADQKVKLNRIYREISRMAADWEDRDNYIASVLDEAAEFIELTVRKMEVDNE